MSKFLLKDIFIVLIQFTKLKWKFWIGLRVEVMKLEPGSVTVESWLNDMIEG